MKGREHPHFLLSTITANVFVYAQAFDFFFSNFQVEMQGSYAKSLLIDKTLFHSQLLTTSKGATNLNLANF